MAVQILPTMSKLWQSLFRPTKPSLAPTQPRFNFNLGLIHFHSVSYYNRCTSVPVFGHLNHAQHLRESLQTFTHSHTVTHTGTHTVHTGTGVAGLETERGLSKTVNGERQEDTNTEFYTLGCINKQNMLSAFIRSTATRQRRRQRRCRR